MKHKARITDTSIPTGKDAIAMQSRWDENLISSIFTDYMSQLQCICTNAVGTEQTT